MTVIEETVEVGHHQTISLAAQCDRFRELECVTEMDAGSIQQRADIREATFAAVLITIDATCFRPQQGKVAEIHSIAVAHNLHLIRHTSTNAQVGSLSSVSLSAHGQCLHVNLTDRVGFLIEHGDNGIVTHAMHHEVLGQDIIIHIVHLIRTNVFRGVASNGEILVVGQQVSSHENAVVTHEQVVVHDRMINIEIEIEWSWCAPFPVAEGTQHELTFKGDVHDGVHRNRFVHRNEMSVLVDTSCLAVLLNGDNRL